MSQDKTSQPIGIFDSGIGGLTIAKAIVEKLPKESIVYFGDTAHLPYGEKSAEVICRYAKRIVDKLLLEKCKLILIACNSASAAAYDFLQEYIGDRALLINVIDPMVQFLKCHYQHKYVGLIGTKLTINSKIYHEKIRELGVDIKLHALATPLLVPAIEEGFFQHPIIDVLLEEYLSDKKLENIDALVLGCTHYPVIKKSIEEFYQKRIAIIDAAPIVAEEVKKVLKAHKLLSHGKKGNKHFFVSDYTAAFAKGAKMFFGENIKLEHYSMVE